jgi:hypothetical protein
VHLNLIAAFPGETTREFERTIDFSEAVLRRSRLGTFAVNPFVLFPRTPAFIDPGRFGLRGVRARGDIVGPANYRAGVRAGLEARSIRRGVPDARARLYHALGVDSVPGRLRSVVDALAVGLYFATGHGLALKAQGISAAEIASAVESLEAREAALV